MKIGIQERGVLLNGKLVNRSIRIAGDRFGDYDRAILFMATYKSAK